MQPSESLDRLGRYGIALAGAIGLAVSIALPVFSPGFVVLFAVVTVLGVSLLTNATGMQMAAYLLGAVVAVAGGVTRLLADGGIELLGILLLALGLLCATRSVQYYLAGRSAAP